MYITNCLNSIANQSFKLWHTIIVDDKSRDGTADIAKEFIKNNNLESKFTFIRNKSRMFALWNVFYATKYFIDNPNAIIGIIDGDDWFNTKDALQIMWDAYAKPTMGLVWSQHVIWPQIRPGFSGPTAKNTPRANRRGISHFKTYRKYLFDQIPEEEFKCPQGLFLRYTYDKAITYPISELCQEMLFINKMLYVYNCQNGYNVHKAHSQEQAMIGRYLEQKKPLR